MASPQHRLESRFAGKRRTAMTDPRPSYIIGAHRYEAETLAPGLYVVATPIGNLGDITVRALATLAAAETVLCEDTRTSGKLMERFAIKTKLTPYHEHNAQKARPHILERLRQGATMALISDAGMPLVSDPGYRLVEGGGGPRHSGDGLPRPFRRAHRPCPLRPSHGPLPVCRLHAAEAGRAAAAVR